MVAFFCLAVLTLAGRVTARGAAPSATGPLGLNTVPSARMDPVGTMRLQASTIGPYAHGSLGLQIAKPLYISLRQTADTGAASRFYPGIDLKISLLGETGRMPALALGLQSAIGHKRMAGEYLAASKRFGDFDLTGGIGWGRMSGGIDNPLKHLLGHFGRKRASDGEDGNGPDDWFTGETVGLFGGVAWDSPIDGLSLKADWNADSWQAEKAAPDFRPSKPWSVGFSYSPRDWMTFGAALIGGNKVYGSLSFQAPVERWPGRSRHRDDPQPFMPGQKESANTTAIGRIAAVQPPGLDGAVVKNAHVAATRTFINPGDSLPYRLGRSARAMAPYSGLKAEAFDIQPAILGLDGPPVRLARRDLEQAMADGSGSPQEIWRHARFGPDDSPSSPVPIAARPRYYGLLLDTKASLSEDDQGVLYRTGLVVDTKHMLTRHLLTGESVRINLSDNLRHLNDFRLRPLLPVRSDEDYFAARRLSVDRSYLSWMQSINRDWHYALTAGYLEEMYAGFGGEILYRPFGRTFAFGAEAWEALKRDPSIPFNLGVNGDHLLTGHLKAWYEIPGTDLTFQAKIGRYLAEDIGGTLSLTNDFRNGASVEAFVTATNKRDYNVFGGETQLYSGLRLRVPLGNIPLVPGGSEARFTAAPFGRDSGQSLDNPLPLYDLTNPFSYRQIAGQWKDIVE